MLSGTPPENKVLQLGLVLLAKSDQLAQTARLVELIHQALVLLDNNNIHPYSIGDLILRTCLEECLQGEEDFFELSAFRCLQLVNNLCSL